MQCRLLFALLFALAPVVGWPADSPAFPTKPVRLIDPFAPGGGTDFVARLISPKLTEVWGQAVIVDSRAGAAGAIGSEIAARSPADGYTLLMATASTMSINPLLSKVPFDPVKDFAAVIQTASIPLVLVVHPAVPAKSVSELIALARAQPGKLNYSTPGTGTLGHLAGELFKLRAAVNLVPVPYKGGGPAAIALLNGEVQADFPNILTVMGHVKSGKVRPLAVTSPKRSPALPELPTVAEGGLPGFDVRNWNGILAPAGTPADVVAKVNRDVANVLRLPDVQERLISSGADIGGGTPASFANHLKAELAKWAEVIRAADVKLN